MSRESRERSDMFQSAPLREQGRNILHRVGHADRSTFQSAPLREQGRNIALFEAMGTLNQFQSAPLREQGRNDTVDGDIGRRERVSIRSPARAREKPRIRWDRAVS